MTTNLLAEALQKIVSGLNCRGTDNAHYCPNCDNSLFDLREIARSALAAYQPAPEEGLEAAIQADFIASRQSRREGVPPEYQADRIKVLEGRLVTAHENLRFERAKVAGLEQDVETLTNALAAYQPAEEGELDRLIERLRYRVDNYTVHYGTRDRDLDKLILAEIKAMRGHLAEITALRKHLDEMRGALTELANAYDALFGGCQEGVLLRLDKARRAACAITEK